VRIRGAEEREQRRWEKRHLSFGLTLNDTGMLSGACGRDPRPGGGGAARTEPPGLRRAVEARDRGRRWTGGDREQPGTARRARTTLPGHGCLPAPDHQVHP
jgi:hypothetical protein